MMNHWIYFEKLSIYNDIKNTLIQRGNLTEEKKNLIDERIAEHKKEYRAWLKKTYGKKYLYPNRYGEIVAGGGKMIHVGQRFSSPANTGTTKRNMNLLRQIGNTTSLHIMTVQVRSLRGRLMYLTCQVEWLHI